MHCKKGKSNAESERIKTLKMFVNITTLVPENGILEVFVTIIITTLVTENGMSEVFVIMSLL